MNDIMDLKVKLGHVQKAGMNGREKSGYNPGRLETRGVIVMWANQ